MRLRLRDRRQRDAHSCGPVAVWIALAFLRIRLRLAELSARLHTTPWDGTDPRVIECVLRELGCGVLSGEMTVEDLRHQARLRRPVILLATLHGCGHYVVGAGVQRGRVYFQDPYSGPGSMPIADFESCWQDFGRFKDRFRGFGMAVWKQRYVSLQ